MKPDDIFLPVYRPPSEHKSYLLRVSYGCPYNQCSFCNMYKNITYQKRSLVEIHRELYCHQNPKVTRVFLMDGDGMHLETDELLLVLEWIKMYFPNCSRVSTYASAQSILSKTFLELTVLRAAGLSMVYIGIESGSNDVLRHIQKESSVEEMVAGCNKAKKAGILISATIIAGLGGRQRWKEHRESTAKVVSMLQADYLGILTLQLCPGTSLYSQYQEKTFTPLSYKELFEELRTFILKIDSEGLLVRANHSSNLYHIAGTLNDGRQEMIHQLEESYHLLDQEHYLEKSSAIIGAPL